ncbi:MAG: hypothetical protein R3344_03445, partial [Acidobacteriota bacterium]|nr:hypothetical protein [Acidobacteriota bacterium]
MSKHTIWMIAALAIALGATALTARGETPDFDLKESQQEIEVMKGILRTTMTFASDDLEGVLADNDWERSAIDGYYLVGQGAVFMISLPAPHGSRFYPAEIVGLSPGPSTIGQGSGYVVGTTAEAPGSDASAAYTEAEDFYRAVAVEGGLSKEELDARRAETEKRRAERERIRAEQIDQFESQLEILKRQLVETLGRHGDSLAQVADDEYVTIILVPGRGNSIGFFGRAEPRR